ncbi:uncharacterized protein RAG0_08181 [Rhynchosporium agropyri]|uniref:Alcohol dehydrogenase-like N-terminal domain-containing protein n=1 Tax=Rhynchosporium agropyri TaxID=914238 RepID=A0A1E1KPG5_9HELO|nr:uncharacterized protein RAG0_08181 [Rhynchosporium agropyri]
MKINPSAPLPKPKPNSHLVKILVTAINPVDYKPTEIPYIGRLLVSYPATPGLDFAGRIVTPATGSNLKADGLVFGVAGTSPLAGGALAEYAVVNEKHTLAIPEGVSILDAAVLGVAGLTAYQSIVPHVKKGDRIFINGGSGSKSQKLLDRLGADVIIDYKKGSVLSALLATEQKFDHAVDNVGNIGDKELWWKWDQYSNPGASYVMVAGELFVSSVIDMAKKAVLPKLLGGVKGKIDGFWPAPKPEDLGQVAQWIKDGKVNR